ncbi:MAG: carbonic anhydrase [Oscillospiraceae bacterium]|nr:carbonic anhydrase [Oscillospiraceae bacterium]
MKETWIRKLEEGNLRWQRRQDVQAELRRKTAAEGQEPYAIVIACSDSRVIPEQIFDAGLGELFVIRVAGNVLDRHQLGSIEYAAGHLHCRLILMLGHTGCGAVGAALSGGGDGFIQYITDEILLAVGEERDPLVACEKNVRHGVEILRREFREHPEIPTEKLEIRGAVYDIASGEVRWLEG